jgi:hypothetical protein
LECVEFKKKGVVCQEEKIAEEQIVKCGGFVKISCEGAKRFQSGMRMADSLLYPLIYFSRFF